MSKEVIRTSQIRYEKLLNYVTLPNCAYSPGPLGQRIVDLDDKTLEVWRYAQDATGNMIREDDLTCNNVYFIDTYVYDMDTHKLLCTVNFAWETGEKQIVILDDWLLGDSVDELTIVKEG